MLGRVPHTLRVWEYHKRLPDHLMPRRNDRGHRIYTLAQVRGLQKWLIDEDIRPGKALGRQSEH